MVILDKIINDLKAKLPLGKKAKEEDEEFEENEEESNSSHQDDATDATDLSALVDEDEEVEEEDDEPVSLVDKIKKKIKSLQKKSSKSEDDEEDLEAADDDVEAAKKKKSKTIQIAIGAALVLFLLSDYIIPPEEPTVPEGTEEIGEAPQGEKPRPVETPVAETPVAETPAAETPTDVATTTPETPVETAPDETVPDVTTETTPESPVEVTSTETPATETTEPTETPAVTDFPADVVTGPSDDASDIPIEAISGDSGEDIVGEDMGQAPDENLTDQILQDLEKQTKATATAEPKKEYVAPPDYEYRGRGLVYNCTGKHWACVDGPSYKTCEDNASSVQYLKKKVECHPFNVYETTRGCESMQNRMVSSSAKTNFCNE